MCAVCDEGFCARHESGSRYQLDHDPYYLGEGELLLERLNEELSAVGSRPEFFGGSR